MSAEDLDCRDLVEVVTDYLEGRLPVGEAARLEAHLRACPGCEAYVAQIRTVLRLGGASRDHEIAGLVGQLVPAFRSYRRGLT